MQVNVLMTGRLTGMGQQAECEVMARRTGGGAQPATYTDPVIIHVREELPEGEYTLHFENISMPVLHKGVLWTVSMPPPENSDEPTPETGPKIQPGFGPVELARRMIRDRRKKK